MIDVAPLRTSAGFRLVFAAQAISMLGAGLTSVAVFLQVYQLTESSLQVGLVGLVFGLSVLVVTHEVPAPLRRLSRAVA